WCTVLQRRFKLRMEVAKKLYFGPPEAKLLIVTALTNPISYTNALQHCVAFLFKLMFGPRPSLLYAVKGYLDCYMLVKDVTLVQEHTKGCGRFSVEIVVRWFKGRHINSRMRLMY
ncbi:hypothetical protein JAAARDRAFT_110485, partial [Jaapia argillacea MUCL 33604]